MKLDKYEQMLDRAYEEMPPIVFEKKRFEVPKAKTRVQGRKTQWVNAKEVADYINRDMHHMAKAISKEIGASFKVQKRRVIFVGRFGSSTLQEKLKAYIDKFVICPVCGKPDTKLEKVDRLQLIKCLACGASKAVK